MRSYSRAGGTRRVCGDLLGIGMVAIVLVGVPILAKVPIVWGNFVLLSLVKCLQAFAISFLLKRKSSSSFIPTCRDLGLPSIVVIST